MKPNLVLFLVVLLGAACTVTTAGAQLGPLCAQCTGTASQPRCDGGLPNGADVCSIQGHSCSTAGQCGDGSGCFVAGTMVDTPYGAISIEDLRIGDEVIGLSDGGALIINEVTSTYRALAVTYIVINDEIAVTGTHSFFVGSRWIEAQSIRVGDALTGDNGAPVPVTSVQIVESGVRVYNITVSGNHTFFAGGWLVHNKEPVPGG